MATPSQFTAPWSTSLKVTTVLVFILMIVINVGIMVSNAPMAARLLVPGITIMTLGIPALYAIRGYELTTDELLIHRLFWTTRIPLAGLTDAIADPKTSYCSIRLWGNGGLFCFCGWFWNRRFGTYRVFATNFANTVVLTIAGKTILVTPDDPAGFVKAIKDE